MSLFDGSGADIWSMGAFPEESSLKDLLDTGIFTLEQLLCEDELLQELKGLHPQLVAYLSKPQICRELIAYLTCTSDQKVQPGEDNLNLTLRFPYIACEIICCEISGIVDTIADGYIDDDTVIDESSTSTQEYDSMASNDGSKEGTEVSQNSENLTDIKMGRTRLLDSLFDLSMVVKKDQSDYVLDEDHSNEDYGFVIDDRLAGYLEKVLSILFRLRPTTLSTYLNDNGEKLLPLFFHHISSYSVTQILQRILLPMDSNGNKINPETNMDPSNSSSGTPINDWIDDDAILKLLLKQIVSSISSQNFKSFDEVTHCTEILISLLQSPNSPLEKLLIPNNFSQILTPLSQIPNPYKPSESRLTHVLHILEAILLQLGGYGMHLRPTKDTKLSIIPFLPKIVSSLREILTHPATKSWKMKCQLKREISQCGVPRLRGIRVLEALVLLGEEEIDQALISEDNGGGDLIGKACDLFWEMEWCSGLHQSVANMIVHVLEGNNKRFYIQNYLINQYNLLEKLLDSFQRNEETFTNDKVRLGYMGHVIIICQAIDHIENSKEESASGEKKDEPSPDESFNENPSETPIHAEIEAEVEGEGGGEEDMKSLKKALNSLAVTEENMDDVPVNGIPPSDDVPSNGEAGPTSAWQLEKDSKKVEGPQDDIDLNSFTLIGQAMSTPLPTPGDSDEIDNNSKTDSGTSNDSGQEISSATTQHSSKLISYLRSHSVYSRWSSFVTTTLAEISDLQSSPLGGTNVDQLGNYGERESNTFDDFDETDHDILGSEGAVGTSLDITENELDIAASMMEALSNGSSSGIDAISETAAALSDRGKDGGGRVDYMYDDPLGRRLGHDEFETEEDKKGNKSLDDEDDEDDINGGSDVQVFDLFVPNYNLSNEINADEKERKLNEEDVSSSDEDDNEQNLRQKREPLDSSWTNFADFESLPVENNAEDKHSPSPREDFFANFGSIAESSEVASPNDSKNYFFDADFSSFSTKEIAEENDSSSNDHDKQMETVVNTKDDAKKEIQTASLSIQDASTSKDFEVGDLFSENTMEILSEDCSEITDKQEENDPFGDFHQRRPSIDELF